MKAPEFLEKVLWIVLGSVFNMVLGTLDRLLALPLFLDSIFTAVVAALFGPWLGLATAVLSQLLMQVATFLLENQMWGPTLPFVLCQFVTALVVGFMARSGHFETTSEVILAVFVVALGNSIVGSFVATFVFGGLNLHAIDVIVTGLIMGGQSLFEASFWARVPVNLLDKGLAVMAAYGALHWWPKGRR